MMRHFLYSVFALLFLITFFSCENDSGPSESPDKFKINAEPISLEFNINPDSLIPETYPEFSTSYNELELSGVYLAEAKYTFREDMQVNREFVLAKNDSFVVEIKNCKNENEWEVDLGSVGLSEHNRWVNTSITLQRAEKRDESDGTVSYKYIFKTIEEGKGYISFIEKDKNGSISSNESHGLLAGYNIVPLHKMYINLDKIEWIYNVKEGTFSTVHVKIKGNTNAFRSRGMTYGDGEVSALEIPVGSDSHFETEIPIAFSHVEGVVLKTSTQLILYGTIALPKIIQLTNPKSNTL